MLTIQDCLELCGLTEDEIEAISEHEHIPDIVALELGEALLKSESGVAEIKRFILDEIALAKAHGHAEKAARFEAAYRHFDSAHPAMPRG
jgi:hypothetical protein